MGFLGDLIRVMSTKNNGADDGSSPAQAGKSDPASSSGGTSDSGFFRNLRKELIEGSSPYIAGGNSVQTSSSADVDSEEPQELHLQPKEYTEQIVIDRPCVIDGHGATVVVQDRPGILVQSHGVVLRNVIIEAPGGVPAIQTTATDTVLENVEVCGQIAGFNEDNSVCSIPKTADIGILTPGERKTVEITAVLPAAAQVKALDAETRVLTQDVGPGEVLIRIEVCGPTDGTNLNTCLYIQTAVTRRIHVRGYAACPITDAPNDPANAESAEAQSTVSSTAFQSAEASAREQRMKQLLAKAPQLAERADTIVFDQTELDRLLAAGASDITLIENIYTLPESTVAGLQLQSIGSSTVYASEVTRERIEADERIHFVYHAPDTDKHLALASCGYGPAAERLEKEADSGNAEAQLACGRLHAYSIANGADRATAIEQALGWFERATANEAAGSWTAAVLDTVESHEDESGDTNGGSPEADTRSPKRMYLSAKRLARAAVEAGGVRGYQLLEQARALREESAAAGGPRGGELLAEARDLRQQANDEKPENLGMLRDVEAVFRRARDAGCSRKAIADAQEAMGLEQRARFEGGDLGDALQTKANELRAEAGTAAFEMANELTRLRESDWRAYNKCVRYLETMEQARALETEAERAGGSRGLELQRQAEQLEAQAAAAGGSLGWELEQKAAHLLQQAANAGLPEAVDEILAGITDAHERTQRLEKFAKDGLPYAQYLLGEKFAEGLDGAADAKQALQWIGQAARQGYMKAIRWLHEKALDGDRMAYAWLRQTAAELSKYTGQRSADAQYACGVMHLEGIGCRQSVDKALECFERAAREGSAEAHGAAARLMRNGQGRKSNAETAMWTRWAAAMGQADDMYLVGLDYLNGSGGMPQSAADAAYWLRRAAGAGSVPAQRTLGQQYRAGNGTAQDDAKAEYWLRLAADADDIEARHDLAMLYCEGRTTGVSLAECITMLAESASCGNDEAADLLIPHILDGNESAAAWLAEGVGKGSPQAQYALACCRAETSSTWESSLDGETRDIFNELDGDAAYWYRLAAEQGHAKAAFRLAEILQQNGDAEDSARWMQAAAEAGIAEAQMRIALTSLDADTPGAVQWLERAAKQGYAEAQYRLGELLLDDPSPGASERGMQLLREAADAGFVPAVSVLGRALRTGRGTARDFAAALDLLRQAADLGDAPAAAALSSMYENGDGVDIDFIESETWFWRAAELGDIPTQIRAGDIYRDGEGVRPDADRAREWYMKAADQGDETAHQRLDELASR